jgi:hypothetical protein
MHTNLVAGSHRDADTRITRTSQVLLLMAKHFVCMCVLSSADLVRC